MAITVDLLISANRFKRTGFFLPKILWLTMALAVAVTGCATQGGESGIGKAMVAAGLKRPSPGATKSVTLRLQAAANLNAANDSRPLAVVVRVYRLRQSQRFEQAPLNVFLDEGAERRALGDDLLGTSEIVLLPGQHHESTELLPPEAKVLGVVALYRSPAPNRWRLSFDAAKSSRKGITVGLHACVLTTTSGVLLTQMSEKPHLMSNARCTNM